ncbi:AraC family of transcriptional regulator, multidrug resistance transcriptional activator [Candidatus Pantoea varia]|uniref:AraC family of transcriptional regulator, multidrug resistance transcriptional activator n=1 Tax=Candidatus Pantoea varia TaxID=1881036 RepID=A0A1I5EQY9_9GAMM|nr:helix-turn-helix domain-containing protein [Pantoea varia]SFO13441.1 AraC family of transcriptional regulator, multidrug resistance transcriptional activator [Pantoea varia]
MSDKFGEAVINDLKMWIERNLHMKLNINDVAAHSGYSKFYIQRLFRKVTGESIARHIRERKLEHARRDLESSNLSVLEIAHKYGFDTQQLFTRVFKKRFSIPPASYRQCHLKDIL